MQATPDDCISTNGTMPGPLLKLLKMPGNWPKEYARYHSAVKFTFPVAIFIHGLLILFFLRLGVKELALFNVLSTLWWCVSFPLATRSIRIALISNMVNIVEMVAHALLCTWYIGWDYGFAFYIYTLILVIFLLPRRDSGIKVLYSAVTLLGFYVCAGILRNIEPRYTVTLYRDIAFIINVSVPLLFTTIISVYYAGFAEYSEQKLASEKEKSEFLLRNILPESIIRKLQKESGIIADEYSEVSVLFADVIDFTPATADRTPKEVVTFLNNLFSVLDEIADRHRLEKIKTIGDAYMVTAGLPEPQEDHLRKIADCALDILDAVKQLDFFGGHCELRIGINSGPVVAGIIGKKKFSYDLWGDTVNTAARMESQGVAGRIQTTRAVFEQLRDTYEFVMRGVVDIKGKGLLETYFLTGKKRSETDTPA